MNFFVDHRPKVSDRLLIFRCANYEKCSASGPRFYELAPQQTSDFLKGFQVIKCIFGDQEKRPAVEIQMKEKWGFQKCAEIFPGPGM
jgi:hypothetical protein